MPPPRPRPRVLPYQQTPRQKQPLQQQPQQQLSLLQKQASQAQPPPPPPPQPLQTPPQLPLRSQYDPWCCDLLAFLPARPTSWPVAGHAPSHPPLLQPQQRRHRPRCSTIPMAGQPPRHSPLDCDCRIWRRYQIWHHENLLEDAIRDDMRACRPAITRAGLHLEACNGINCIQHSMDGQSVLPL